MILPRERDPRLTTIRRGGTLTDEDHRLLALWAASCAEHVLPLFERVRPDDRRPRRALDQVRAWVRGELDLPTSAIAKCWVSDSVCQVVDECVQLHGGYGYMMEYPIAELFVDARVQRIYGGTNEIMKELASRFM